MLVGNCDKCGREGCVWLRGERLLCAWCWANDRQRPTPSVAIIQKDASYRDGVAGLAVVTAWGEFTRVTNASLSREAEEKALLWAMEIALERGVDQCDFYTDCDPREDSREIFRHLHARIGWRVVTVHRSLVADAHRLSRRAIRGIHA